MGADLRFTIPKHTSTFLLQVVTCGEDIVNLVTDVVDAACWVFVEEPLNG